jgi:transposase
MVRLRTLTDEEQQVLKRLARSRTAPARTVERAKMLVLAHDGRSADRIGRTLGCGGETVRRRLKRFNEVGLAALNDAPRAGRRTTYTPEDIGLVVATALTKPVALGLPFASWTLDRLSAYLRETKQFGMKRSRIAEVLAAEGLRWRQEETWFSERVDPAFEEKRGPSSGSIPVRQPRASWSASMSLDH